MSQLKEENFIDPISGCYFNHPVLASDGHFYENSCLLENFVNDNYFSPVTGERLNKTVMTCKFFELLLAEFYNQNPDFGKKRYIEGPSSIFTPIHRAIKLHNFSELLNYDNFDFRVIIEKNLLDDLILCKNKDIIKYVIESGINLEYENINNERLIHKVIVHSCPKFFVKYLIKKGVDLECEDIDGRRPIHKACLLGSYGIVKLLVEKGVDLECKDVDGKRPIHYSLEISNYRIFPYLIDHVDLESEDKYGRRPIHYACIHTNPYNYLTCEFIYKEKPVDYDIGTAHLKYVVMLMKKQVDTECKDYFDKKPIDYAIEQKDQNMVELFI